jgi:hypothetical protein
VDALLRGYPIPPEIRYRDEHGEIRIERPAPPARQAPGAQGFRRQNGEVGQERPRAYGDGRTRAGEYERSEMAVVNPVSTESGERTPMQTVHIYAYGVARNRLIQAAKRLGVPAVVVNDVQDANILVTLRSYYRDRQRPVVDAENRGMPIYVLRANTVNQMQQFLTDLFNLSVEQADERGLDPAMHSTQAAIEAVLNGERWVELPPASAYIRRLQHQMVRQANLTSHSYGKEPYRRVRIFRD